MRKLVVALSTLVVSTVILGGQAIAAGGTKVIKAKLTGARRCRRSALPVR